MDSTRRYRGGSSTSGWDPATDRIYTDGRVLGPVDRKRTMQSRSVLLASLAVLASATAAQAQAIAPLKIGYINSAAILEEAPGAKEASAEFDRYLQQSQAEVQRLSQELEARRAEYQRQQLMLSPAAKTQREEEMLRMQQEAQQRVQALETQ